MAPDPTTVTKRGAADRLAGEAAILAAAAGPGVVAVHRHAVQHDPAAEAVLETTFAGARTLASSRPSDVRTTARTVAGVARTIARLHQLGIGHGAVSADHVQLRSF